MFRELKRVRWKEWLRELDFFLSLEKRKLRGNLTAIFLYLLGGRSENGTRHTESISDRARSKGHELQQEILLRY